MDAFEPLELYCSRTPDRKENNENIDNEMVIDILNTHINHYQFTTTFRLGTNTYRALSV